MAKRSEASVQKPAGGFLEEAVRSLTWYYSQSRKVIVAGQTQRELDRLRQQFQGVFRRDEYTDHFPKIAFKSAGLDAVLAVWPRDPELSEFQVNIAFSNPATGSEIHPYPPLEMYSHNMGRTVLPAKGLSKVILGDSLLDHHFCTLAVSDPAVRRLLTVEARQLVMSLYYASPHHNLYLGLEYERAIFKKVVGAADLTAPMLSDTSSVARQLIERFLGRLIMEELDQEALQILAIDLPEETARCQVCGERVALDKIECTRCDTPHHRDCWEYNGRCAVYACGETRYRVAA